MKSLFEYVENRVDVDLEILEEAKKRKKKWIPELEKGRCTPMPNPDCPEGSPQYNLALRFKSGEFHKKKKKN